MLTATNHYIACQTASWGVWSEDDNEHPRERNSQVYCGSHSTISPAYGQDQSRSKVSTRIESPGGTLGVNMHMIAA